MVLGESEVAQVPAQFSSLAGSRQGDYLYCGVARPPSEGRGTTIAAVSLMGRLLRVPGIACGETRLALGGPGWISR
jgi:hypothetical protein